MNLNWNIKVLKMKESLINYLKSLNEILIRIKSNILITKFLRKPFNTFILPNFYNEKKLTKDAEKWKSEKVYKTDQFKKVDSISQDIFIKWILNNTSKEDSILDICCNQGRHLKSLHKNGYRKLAGFDVMEAAIENLKVSTEFLSGGIYAESNLAHVFIKNASNLEYDYAITFAGTIELMHPGFKIFEELNRIIKKGFIFAINENGHTYPRFYRYQIESNGFKIIKHEKIAGKTILNCRKV